ncbi:MAG: RidA family protein [Vicinamibacterales bacterium]
MSERRRPGTGEALTRRALMCGALAILLSSTTGAMQTKQIINRDNLNLPFSSAVKAGGLIYVSGAMGTDAQGRILGADVKAQTKQTLDNLAATLKDAGSSMAQVASVTVYLKNVGDFAAMNDVYKTYWPKDPPTRTTVITNLVLPDGLVEMSMVAIPNGGERKVVHPGDWMTSPNPYSYGIQSGNTLFMAGLIARSGKDNTPVEGDMTTQTKAVLANASSILSAAGMSAQDVVSARVYITDTAGFQDMNAAYRTFFTKDPPARATVRVGLTAPQYKVEITMVAVKDSTRTPFTTPAADGTPGQANPNLSSAIRVGNRLYVSGILGNTDTNKTDAAAQTRETMARIRRTLTAAGFDWTHVVDGVVYITDVKNFGAMNTAYKEVLSKDFPARATVETGLMGADGLVEIMFTAVK